MNRRFWIFGLIGLAMVVLSQGFHWRSDVRTGRFHVPELASERDIRIVTNAALEEILGRYDGVQHRYQVDLPRGLVVYHDPGLVTDAGFRDRVVSRIAEVGYAATFQQVARNPLPPARSQKGELFDIFPGRHTAVIAVKGMKSNVDANRVVCAISLARTGDAPQSIQLDRAARTFTITFNGRRVGLKNIQHAIAASGFAADDLAARCGQPDAEPHNWTPLLPGDV